MRIYVLQEWIGDNWDGYWSSVNYTLSLEVATNWSNGNSNRDFDILEEYVPAI